MLVLLAFVALFALALDVRVGLAALVAATIIDWLYIGAPFWPARRQNTPRR